MENEEGFTLVLKFKTTISAAVMACSMIFEDASTCHKALTIFSQSHSSAFVEMAMTFPTTMSYASFLEG